MAPDAKARDKIFISYSHMDDRWASRLVVHLNTIEKQHPVEVWHDKKIEAGDDWLKEITEALESAAVAVVLVSVDFLASKFITSVELPTLLTKAHDEGMVILAIFVGPSTVERLRLVLKFQGVNDPDNPLLGMGELERERVFVEAAERCGLILNGPPARSEIAPLELFEERGRSACHEYGGLFEIHIKRQSLALLIDYALAVPAALVGLWLVIATWLLGNFKRQPNAEVVKLLIGAAAVAIAFVIIKRGVDKYATIAFYKFMKRKFEKCESWTAAELRENIRIATYSLRKMLQS